VISFRAEESQKELSCTDGPRCGLTGPSFGLPGEGLARWCATCAAAHPGAAELGVDYGSTGKEARWEAQLAKLAAYKAVHDDCRVLTNWKEDPSLGAWVAKQRGYKRLLDRGEACREMSAERAAKLEAIGCEFTKGFVWIATEDVTWEVQLAQLMAYKVQHSDCKVPSNWPENPQLGRWVSLQRVCKNSLDTGEPCRGMKVERVAKLDALGFAWTVAPYKGGPYKRGQPVKRGAAVKKATVEPDEATDGATTAAAPVGRPIRARQSCDEPSAEV
jgi:hypothetical protein